MHEKCNKNTHKHMKMQMHKFERSMCFLTSLDLNGSIWKTCNTQFHSWRKQKQSSLKTCKNDWGRWYSSVKCIFRLLMYCVFTPIQVYTVCLCMHKSILTIFIWLQFKSCNSHSFQCALSRRCGRTIKLDIRPLREQISGVWRIESGRALTFDTIM